MKRFLLASLLLAATTSALAKDNKFYQTGTLVQMDSVECGMDENSGKGFVGAMIGTDNSHKKTKAMMCPEYVLRTERTIYRIRPREDKNPAILPIGEQVRFRMKKDRMVLRVPEGDDKEREYNVIGATQTAAAAASDNKVADAKPKQ